MVVKILPIFLDVKRRIISNFVRQVKPRLHHRLEVDGVGFLDSEVLQQNQDPIVSSGEAANKEERYE